VARFAHRSQVGIICKFSFGRSEFEAIGDT